MNGYHIGRLVEQERKNRGVTLKQLSRGIFSPQMLIKLEGNTSESDNLVVDILLQRLGRSPDKLEIFMSLSEYKKIKARDMIEELILQNKVSKAEYLLKRYREVLGKENNVHMMYYNRTKAYLLMRNGGAIEDAMSYIEEALNYTLAGWDEDELSGFLISTYEMENLLVYGKLLYMSGRREEAQVHLDKCLYYIEHHYMDTEEFAKIYPKCAWLLSKVYFEGDYDEKIVPLCERAIDILRREGIGYFALPVMEEMIVRYKRMGNKERESYWKVFFDVFRELYDEYAPDMCLDSLFFNVRQREYHLDYETIKGERLAKGYSQDKLIEGVYNDARPLSLVENHKRTAGKQFFEKLMSNLEMDKRRYNGLLATDSFEVLQKKNVYDYFVCIADYSSAEKVLCELEELLDENVEDNRRFVELNRLLMDRSLRKLSPEAELEKLRRLLDETYNIDAENNRVPMRNEVTCINQIGICLGELGRHEEKAQLLKKAIDKFVKSKVDVKYNVRSYMLLKINYIEALYDGKIRAEALTLARQTMEEELRFAKARRLASFCIILACGNIKQESMREKCRHILKQAYFLDEFEYSFAGCKSIANYYKMVYNEEII